MSRKACYEFRLYVAGNTPNSAQAKVNLSALCRKHLAGRYKIEVVDVFRHPERALIDGIYMTPALLKLAPSPTRMIVGTLSGSVSLLAGLGLSADDDPGALVGSGESHGEGGAVGR
jgi:circadian clock protein KaiB